MVCISQNNGPVLMSGSARQWPVTLVLGTDTVFVYPRVRMLNTSPPEKGQLGAVNYGTSDTPAECGERERERERERVGGECSLYKSVKSKRSHSNKYVYTVLFLCVVTKNKQKSLKS